MEVSQVHLSCWGEHTGVDGKINGIDGEHSQHYNEGPCLFLVRYKNTNEFLGKAQRKQTESYNYRANDDEGSSTTPSGPALVGNDANNGLDYQSR